MYEKLGRMMGRSYEETVQILIKVLRNGESQLRIEIMVTLEQITAGMGTAAANVHKDIYKAAKIGLADRALPVRCASAMVGLIYFIFLVLINTLTLIWNVLVQITTIMLNYYFNR